MGYNTRYSLEIESPSFMKEVAGVDANGNPATIFVPTTLDLEDLKREIGAVSGYSYLWDDSCKWYDHDTDMCNVSREYPTVLFKLYGEGEDPGDLWMTYYKNGKMQKSKAKITYDTFDPAKLV